jgi:excisionase family DNA binding protein
MLEAMKPRDDATALRFMTVAEVADYLHVSLATVHRLAHHGQIPAFRIGRGYRFDRDAIEKLVTDRTGEMVNKEWRGGSR